MSEENELIDAIVAKMDEWDDKSIWLWARKRRKSQLESMSNKDLMSEAEDAAVDFEGRSRAAVIRSVLEDMSRWGGVEIRGWALEERRIELRELAEEDLIEEADDEELIADCKFCDQQNLKAELHEGLDVCTSCWDERLRTTA